MYRDDHYRAADALVAKARRRMAETGSDGWTPDSAYDRGNVMAWLAAAQVHATLAAAGPGVEQAVRDHEKRVAQALGATEGDQRTRQAARPPLVEDRATTCRCTGLPHDLGSAGCEVPGYDAVLLAKQREAERGRPLPTGKGAAENTRVRDHGSDQGAKPDTPVRAEEAAGTVRPKSGPPVDAERMRRELCHCPGGGGLDGLHKRGVPGCSHEVQR